MVSRLRSISDTSGANLPAKSQVSYLTRFGDFEGFELRTEGKLEIFRGHEHEIEELVDRAWRHRYVISVVVDADEPHWPRTIIYRRAAAAEWQLKSG